MVYDLTEINNNEYWQAIFESGKSLQGQSVIASGGINLIGMISDREFRPAQHVKQSAKK